MIVAMNISKVELVKIFLPAALVCAGFYVNHLTALKRDKRKEQRALLDSIAKELFLLMDASIDFHTSPAHNMKNVDQILHAIEQIDKKIQRTCMMQCKFIHDGERGFNDRKEKITTKIKHLRQSVTLNNFDASSFVPKPINDQLIYDIRESITALEAELENQLLLHHKV